LFIPMGWKVSGNLTGGIVACRGACAGFVLLLLFTLLTACSKPPQLSRLQPDDVILAFGDSLTYGTGATAEESYPAILAQLVSRQVVRAGVPGETTAQGLRRLPAVLDAHGPRLVIVCLGGNDMLRKQSEAATRTNLTAIIRTIRDRGIDVVLIGVPKPALLPAVPDFYQEIAREFGVPYEAGVVRQVLIAPEMKSDPIHPNALGYRRMAEALAQLLRSAGAL